MQCHTQFPQSEQMMYLITTINILREISYQNRTLYQIPIGYHNYQIAIASSTSIIIVRIVYFTIAVCVYIMVLYLFYIKWLFTNLFSFHFQTKDRDTHVYAPSWLPNDGNRNQQNNQLLDPFLFVTCFYIS